jgi:hypothetical protein
MGISCGDFDFGTTVLGPVVVVGGHGLIAAVTQLIHRKVSVDELDCLRWRQGGATVEMTCRMCSSHRSPCCERLEGNSYDTRYRYSLVILYKPIMYGKMNSTGVLSTTVLVTSKTKIDSLLLVLVAHTS